jgi:hypothetical protein
MTRLHRFCGRITAKMWSTWLVAAVSGAFVAGNAVWSAPPRFDGAGYTILAQALLSGQGYRTIDHPGHPSHTHFPPGYPIFLTAIWQFTGRSLLAAHLASAGCTVGAAAAFMLWMRSVLPRRAALLTGLTLAVNWQWARTGSAILSEPLFLLESQLTIFAALGLALGWSARAGRALTVGILLGASILTRHAAIGFALAILLDLSLRQRWGKMLAVAAVSGATVTPWFWWIATAGSAAKTQAGLLVDTHWTWLERFYRPIVFYAQRIPDQLFGPFVEVGSAPGRNLGVVMLANASAILVTGLILAGWLRLLKDERRRLAALVPLCSLGVLGAWPFTEAGRFLTPLVPFLLIGMVEGISSLIRRVIRKLESPMQPTLWPRPCGAVGSVRELESAAHKAPFPESIPSRLPRRTRFVSACLVLAVALPYSCYALMWKRTRALEASHRDFDAACQWLALRAEQPGPVISRHPGEVFWQTGREGLEVPAGELSGDREANDRTITRLIQEFHVAYVLVDEGRYSRAAANPLSRIAVENPAHFREVFRAATDRSTVVIYEVVSNSRASTQRPSNRSLP